MFIRSLLSHTEQTDFDILKECNEIKQKFLHIYIGTY